MSGMDLSGRRQNRGISVFWMILAMAVGVFALIAILLVGTEQAVEPLPADDGAEVIVNEGETQVLGSGNSEAAAESNDPTMLDDDVTVSGPQEEGDLAVEDVEVDVEPGDPVGGEVVDPAEDGGTDADAGLEEAVNDPGATEDVVEGEVAPEAATGEAASEEVEAPDAEVPGEGEVIVDPDGTTAPVEPTPSGPEGRDDETVADEIEEITE